MKSDLSRRNFLNVVGAIGAAAVVPQSTAELLRSAALNEPGAEEPGVEAPGVEVLPADFEQRALYHSPETPGYTAWVSLRQSPDKTLRCAFLQSTGPADKQAKLFMVFESHDGARTWTHVHDYADGVPPPCDRMTKFLSDGTMIRARDNGEGHDTAFLELSTDGGNTWERGGLVARPKEYDSVSVSFILPLRDGRIVLWAVCHKIGAAKYDVLNAMFVTSDRGKTWGDPIVLMEGEKGLLCLETECVELRNGDLLWIHRAEHYPGKIMTVAPPAFAPPSWFYKQSDPAEFFWVERRQTITKKVGQTFVAEPSRQLATSHSGCPCLLMTKEGVILDLRPKATQWSNDEGQTWHDLMVNLTGWQKGPLSTGWYPRTVQLDDGRILCISHRGNDDPYLATDKVIIQQVFRLNLTLEQKSRFYWHNPCEPWRNCESIVAS